MLINLVRKKYLRNLAQKLMNESQEGRAKTGYEGEKLRTGGKERKE